MIECDYKQLVEIEYKEIKKLEGKTLNQIYVHTFSGRIFMSYLELDHTFYMITGRIGSEYIGVSERKEAGELIEERRKIKQTQNDMVSVFEPFSIFVGKKIVQVRMMGEAWNGHGFEFSFESVYDKTAIFQSIYAGEKDKSWHTEDCIRLGIGTYIYDYGYENKDE